MVKSNPDESNELSVLDRDDETMTKAYLPREWLYN